MIVFPQGGVLRMSTPVTAGQMMVVTNLKIGHDAICRVVKVRAYAQSQSYVEIEFTNRQQGYWGVQFAGEDVEPAKPFAPQPSCRLRLRFPRRSEWKTRTATKLPRYPRLRRRHGGPLRRRPK